MLQILYKYFILNKKAVIPGIGVFYIHRQPATLDFSNKAFTSPAAQIAFTQADVDADKKFYSFVSNEKQIEEADALLYFTNFTNRVKENLHTKGRVELNGFGVLSKDVAGTLQFHPAKPIPSFLQNVAAERTIREVSDEEMLAPDNKRKNNQTEGAESEEAEATRHKKEYWWVFAIILAAAAIAAIIYYYNQNGSLR